MDDRVKYSFMTNSSSGSTTSTGSSIGSNATISSNQNLINTSNNTAVNNNNNKNSSNNNGNINGNGSSTFEEAHPIPLSHHQARLQATSNPNNQSLINPQQQLSAYESHTSPSILASVPAAAASSYNSNQSIGTANPIALPHHQQHIQQQQQLHSNNNDSAGVAQQQQHTNSPTDSSSSTVSSGSYNPAQDFARMQKIIKKKAMDRLPTIPTTYTGWISKPRQKVMLFDYIFITLGLISSDSHTLQAEKALKKNHEEFEQDPMNIRTSGGGGAGGGGGGKSGRLGGTGGGAPISTISSGVGSGGGGGGGGGGGSFSLLGGGLRKLKNSEKSTSSWPISPTGDLKDGNGGGGAAAINDDLQGDEGSSANSDAKSTDSNSKLVGAEYHYGSRVVSLLRHAYCRLVCLFLWSAVCRLGAAFVMSHERSILVLDYYYLGKDRHYYMIPALCVSLQSAAISLVFIRNGNETNWLVPFYSSKDYLIQAKNAFKPSVSEYTNRINFNVAIATILSVLVTGSLGSYIYFTMEAIDYKTDEMRQRDQIYIILWTIYNLAWAFYSTFTCVFVSFYFNVICSVMRARFHKISRIIENLAESETTKSSNQSRKITTLYLEHNEACELLDESNDFWQYLIFFTYFTYIPGHCYCLYNLFFVEFDFWPNFVTWTIYIYTGFIIGLNSFSASGVSTEAHAPYTSLHTLSLIQLPVDVEVNISTFLHRVRGLTIGYSCYDLFAVTNASMSNTAAACASYFLIVADFSRSSVFAGQQQPMSNLSNNVASAASAVVKKIGETAAASGVIATN